MGAGLAGACVEWNRVLGKIAVCHFLKNFQRRRLVQYLRSTRSNCTLDLDRASMKSGIDDDWNMARGFICFQPRRRFISGHPRQAEIHKYQIGMRGMSLVDCVEPGCSLGDIISRAPQNKREKIPRIGVVFDDKNPFPAEHARD